MYTRPTRPHDIGGVLDDAVRLYRASFSRCWGLALVGGVLGAAFGLYATLHSGLGGTASQLTGAGAAAAMVRLRAMERSPGLWGSYLLILLTWLIIRAALIARQNAIATGNDDTAGSALALGLRQLPAMIVAGIVWGIMILVGFVVLFIPGVWLWGQLQLWLVAMTAEGIGPFKALGRSWTLVEHHWWRTSTTVGVAIVIVWVLSLLGGVGSGLGVYFFRTDPALALLLGQLIGAAINIFTMPMLTAALVAIYHDLRLRRDGGDLAARVSTLQAV
jgi:hypothetical protein